MAEERTKLYQSEAPVTAACANNLKAVFAFGDGKIATINFSDYKNQITEISSGAVLSLDLLGDEIFAGDDLGNIKRVKNNAVETLKTIKGKWVEVIKSSERLGLVAAAVGKEIHVFGKKRFTKTGHESTITDLCFAPKGNRLAAAHYNGVTLWPMEENSRPEKWPHKGSHLSITWSPDGTYIVTGTQEKMLKIWNLKTNDDLFMSGYASKVKSFAWLKNGAELATSGAEQIVIWPFSGSGPKGKTPVVIGPAGNDIITHVAAHSKKNVIAAAYENGMLIIADVASKEWFRARAADVAKITALAWSGDGRHIIFGDEAGNYGVLLAG